MADAGGLQGLNKALKQSQDIQNNSVSNFDDVEETKETPVTKTTDVFGKSLREFKQLRGHDKHSVPLVFHLLVGYFQKNPLALRSEGLFRVATDNALVRELEVHFASENYHHITEVESPNVVTNYFKLLLR